MAVSDVYDFYKRMEDDNIILSFKGTFSEELLTALLHILENKMNSIGIEAQKKKRVFNVLVECFQNLYHHVEDISSEMGISSNSALVMVRYNDRKFNITTGNFIRTEKITELKQRLDAVNDLNEEDLRELYRNKLASYGRTEKGTAGLGLIDIARKSKKKLQYEIVNVTDSIGFFCMCVLID